MAMVCLAQLQLLSVSTDTSVHITGRQIIASVCFLVPYPNTCASHAAQINPSPSVYDTVTGSQTNLPSKLKENLTLYLLERRCNLMLRPITNGRNSLNFTAQNKLALSLPIVKPTRQNWCFLTCVKLRLAVCLSMVAMACPNHNLIEQTQRLLGYQLNK